MSQPGEVYQGRDGWLFLAGTLASMYDRNSPALPDMKLHEWVQVIETRAKRLETMGIQYIHMPAPEKLTIYDDKMSEPIVDWRLSPALRLGERVRNSPHANVWLDIVEPLRAARDRKPLFPKTDSHWNAEGAFIAYRCLCDRLAIAPDLDLMSRKCVDYHDVFDLGASMSPKVAEWFKHYDFTEKSTRTYANSIARHLESANHAPVVFGASHVAFRNGSRDAARKKILIFGDSFCSQGMSSLTGMLAETARHVEFVWSSDLDWKYIERSRPDVVLYEVAERIMWRLPQDDLSLRLLFWKRGWKADWHRLKGSIRRLAGFKVRLTQPASSAT
jgi:alginate O-acetyltransferase complex protein AlgJ